MIEYNAINTVVHYFIKSKQKTISFSLSVCFAGEVVKAPPGRGNYLTRNIDEVAAELIKKGYEHHIIN